MKVIVKAIKIIIKDISKVLKVMVNVVKVMVKVIVKVLVKALNLAFKSHLHFVFTLQSFDLDWELLVPFHNYLELN